MPMDNVSEPFWEFRKKFRSDASDQLKEIVNVHLNKWLTEFASKNADYANSNFNTADLLGAKGQFAELWRKTGKLYGPMWEDKNLNHEQVDEILRDLIGHCFLALHYNAKDQPLRSYQKMMAKTRHLTDDESLKVESKPEEETYRKTPGEWKAYYADDDGVTYEKDESGK